MIFADAGRRFGLLGSKRSGARFDRRSIWKKQVALSEQISTNVHDKEIPNEPAVFSGAWAGDVLDPDRVRRDARQLL
jgi:hypothetical protein